MTPFIISLHFTDNGLRIEAGGRIIEIPNWIKKIFGPLMSMLVNRQQGQPVLCHIHNEGLLPMPQQQQVKERLTPREIEVANMIIEGDTGQKNACKMHIDYKTYKTHRTNLYAKLGINKNSELPAAMLRYNSSCE